MRGRSTESEPSAGTEAPDLATPFPGVRLRATLSLGGGATFRYIAWSPDGRLLAAGLPDGSIAIWDYVTGTLAGGLFGHAGGVTEISWSRDGELLASASLDQTVRIWNVRDAKEVSQTQFSHVVTSVAWQPTGALIAAVSRGPVLATASRDPVLATVPTGQWDGVYLWNAVTGAPARPPRGARRRYGTAKRVAWSSDGSRIAMLWFDSGVTFLDVGSNEIGLVLALPRVHDFAWSSDGRHVVASIGNDVPGQVGVWEVDTGRKVAALEGHTSTAVEFAFSADGRLFAMKTFDRKTWLRRCDTWDVLGTVPEGRAGTLTGGLAFHPHHPILATADEGDACIRLWDLDLPTLLGDTAPPESVRHVVAKVVLVGDSGVGKSTLGWRMAHDEFKEQSSTHGQQFWVLDQLRTTRDDGTTCEAVLWDLGGQPDYRLVHALFLDDAEMALVLFNAAERTEPLRGVDYWLKALARPSGRPCHIVLVGARVDRGDLALTPAEVEAFRRARGVDAYVPTSARSGEGVARLLEHVREQLPWDAMPVRATTLGFKRIKDCVLALKEGVGARVLVEPAELRRHLAASDPGQELTDDDMMGAVANLAAHGYVRVLRAASGMRHILLRPELLNNLAASMVLEARRNPKGLGALDEARLLAGGYALPELDALTPADRELLLDAAEVLFLEHNVCFRESLGVQTYLVFPELINLKKPAADSGVPLEDDVSYTISGPVTNLYAALVVLLGYTNVFTRTDQWQNQAQYDVASGEVCGFRQVSDGEGELELVLYYSAQVGSAVRLLFQGLVERFLTARPVVVTRYPPRACDKCGYRQERAEVVRRTTEGRDHMFCSECGYKVLLTHGAEPLASAPELRTAVSQQQHAAVARTRFQTALVQLLSFIRDADAPARPRVFISYAWGRPEHERWVEKRLASDLQSANLEVTLDRWHNAQIGANLARFVELITESRYVVAVGTPLYQQKYTNRLSTTGSVVAAEVDLINQRLLKSEQAKATVMPVLLDGTDEEAFPPLMRGRTYADFRDERAYYATLFDLVLTVHGIRFDDKAVIDLRETLRPDQLRV